MKGNCPQENAATDNLFVYKEPPLKKPPPHVILHIGTNETINSTSHQIRDKTLELKNYMKKNVENCTVIKSNPIARVDNGKAGIAILHLEKKFKKTICPTNRPD